MDQSECVNIPILQLQCDAVAIFKKRSNRFLGIVDIINPMELENVLVHIHDPGRLVDILYPDNKILLKKIDSLIRKTKWDILAGQVNNQWILIHSGPHSEIVRRIFRNEKLSPIKNIKSIKSEMTYGHSRLDFLLEDKNHNKIWIEVKGCTLSIENKALFPDAPTKRGSKHLESLIAIKNKGMRAALIVLIFRPDATCFAPYGKMDPQFTATFYRAIEAGVEVYPIQLNFKDGNIYYKRPLEICY